MKQMMVSVYFSFFASGVRGALEVRSLLLVFGFAFLSFLSFFTFTFFRVVKFRISQIMISFESSSAPTLGGGSTLGFGRRAFPKERKNEKCKCKK
jgi:hypothetical protein